jgi:hypothetical protein
MQTGGRFVTFSYRELTDNSYRRISQLMEESRQRKGDESLQRREWAYGLYLGWRAVVAERVEPDVFAHDDEILESLLKN